MPSLPAILAGTKDTPGQRWPADTLPALLSKAAGREPGEMLLHGLHGEKGGSCEMKALIEYIMLHTERGECQCGKCCDKQEDRERPKHSVNIHFFWVSPLRDPNAKELRFLLESEYPGFDRLRDGPSYIEIGGHLGSQELALRLIGLGALLGLWDALTPESLGASGEVAEQAAAGGFVMCGGFREKEQAAK